MHASLLDGAIHHCDSDVYWRKDGTSFPVEYTSTPIVQDGRIRGAVVVFHDVTERRTIERIRDEFTSVVSHELRTPLTSIRGSLGLLESGVLGPLPERAQRMTQIAVENTDRLVRLINDILDLERLDSDGLQLRESTCDAEQLIARATEVMLSAAVAADVTLAVDSAPAAFEADADRVIQTLTNLIGNAVKFSPRGGTVQISSVRRSEEILFTVRDTGRGVPADQLESIFGRFQQVDSTDSRQSGGTGLGLAICRSIVELHGGRIWARSSIGEGSTFSFVLPAADEPASEYTPRAGGTRGSVLMCDDNAEILEITGTLLEDRGYHVIATPSGERAVERARAEHPDVILLDLLLPGMSGAQTAAALRAHDETSSIPVVVLSVLPRSDEQMAAGAFVDWIEKPADPDELVAALDRAIGQADDVVPGPVHRARPGGRRAPARSVRPPRRRVLRGRRRAAGARDLRADPAGPARARRRPAGDRRLGRPELAARPATASARCRWSPTTPAIWRPPRTSAGPRGPSPRSSRRDRSAIEEFQWRVMTLLARPHIPSRTAEASHEPEAHPARR